MVTQAKRKRGGALPSPSRDGGGGGGGEPIRVSLAYTPTPKQRMAMEAKQHWVLYGGAEGGGKTLWLAQTLLDLMLDYPGIEVVAARYDYQKLMEPTQLYDVLNKVIPNELVEKRFRVAPAWIRLWNGSRVTFLGLHDYHPSAEYGAVAVDQAEEVPEETLRLLNGRLRQRLPDGSFPRFRMLLTCNPDPNMEWFLEEAREHPEEFAFIPALPEDNPYLPEDFLEKRRRSYTPEQWKRYIEGSWEVWSGRAVPEFQEEVHVVPSFETWRRERWPVYLGIDVGSTQWTVAEWIAVSPEGDWFVVQEYAAEGEVPRVNAQAVAARSLGLPIRAIFIDHRSAQMKTDLGVSVTWSARDDYRAALGREPTLAGGTRQDRLAAWRQALRVDPLREHYLEHTPGAPRLYIFEECKRLRWELPRLRLSPTNPEEAAKVDDHAFDAAGFVLTHLWTLAEPAAKPRGLRRLLPRMWEGRGLGGGGLSFLELGGLGRR
jgi:hypothetical protein